MYYLYVKKHKTTGLKYFGYTTKSNPYTYLGSGVHWLRHLKKHGSHVETLQIFKFINHKECSTFAISFSLLNNIVESREWANLIIENAIMSHPMPLAIKQKISDTKKGTQLGHNNPFWGKNHTDKTKDKIRQARLGSKMTETQRLAMIKAVTGISKSQTTKEKMATYASKRIWIVNQNGQCKHAKSTDDPRILSGEYQLGKKWKIKT